MILAELFESYFLERIYLAEAFFSAFFLKGNNNACFILWGKWAKNEDNKAQPRLVLLVKVGRRKQALAISLCSCLVIFTQEIHQICGCCTVVAPGVSMSASNYSKEMSLWSVLEVIMKPMQHLPSEKKCFATLK